jgi:hypothetical protein
VWNRDPSESSAVLSLPWLKGQDLVVSTVFPRSLARWPSRWDPVTGELTVTNPTGQASARLLDIAVSGVKPLTAWQAIVHA